MKRGQHARADLLICCPGLIEDGTWGGVHADVGVGPAEDVVLDAPAGHHQLLPAGRVAGGGEGEVEGDRLPGQHVGGAEELRHDGDVPLAEGAELGVQRAVAAGHGRRLYIHTHENIFHILHQALGTYIDTTMHAHATRS